MAQAICAPKYRSVNAFMVTWDIDGISTPTRELTRVFQDAYYYTVHEICLPLAGKLSIWDLLRSVDMGAGELLIFYYLGSEIKLRDHLKRIILNPLCSNRQGQALDPETRWPENLISTLHVSSDLLLILDCFLDNLAGHSKMDQSDGIWSLLNLVDSHVNFELMAAGYKDRSIKPGAFSSYMATSLEIAAARAQCIDQEGSVSTEMLRMKISELSDIEGQRIQPFHMRHFEKDESVAWITLYPTRLFPLKRPHEQLDRDDQARLLENKMPIYENGITEVFKTHIIRGSQGFSEKNNVMTCVVKRYRPRNKKEALIAATMFKTEAECLRKLSAWRHGHVLELLGSFETPSECGFGHCNLILPYAEGGDLYYFLRLSVAPEWLHNKGSCIPLWQTIYTQAVGIVDALAFIHSEAMFVSYVIHRDIKPFNILIHNGTFKIADFGHSCLKSSGETSKTEWLAGTSMYAPPERLRGFDSYGRARDVWALGCVLLEILALIISGFCETAAVDVFEQERLNSSQNLEARAFCLTMDCVYRWMGKIGKNIEEKKEQKKDRDSEERKHSLGKLLETIRHMLKVNPLERIESSQALNSLVRVNKPDERKAGRERKRQKHSNSSQPARMEISAIGNYEPSYDQEPDTPVLGEFRTFEVSIDGKSTREQNGDVLVSGESQIACRPKQNVQDDCQSRALHLAVINEHLDVVTVLLESGFNPNSHYEDGVTALHTAAINGYESITELLLSKGADVRIRGKYGLTALHFAAIGGYEATVTILLNNLADPADPNLEGETSLHFAAKYGNEDVVQLLLKQRSVNPNAKCRKGLTAMSKAAMNGHLGAVKILVDKEGSSIRGHAIDFMPLNLAIYYGQAPVVQMLLELRTLDLELKDGDPLSLLDLAAEKGHSGVALVLLNGGVEINLQSEEGWTALGRAASKGHEELVQLLLERGANMDLRTDDGYTALLRAAGNGHENIVRTLLQRGANAATCDNNGWTMLHWASINGHYHMVQCLLENGMDPLISENTRLTPLHLAAHEGREEIVQLLLEQGVDVNSQDVNGVTALHLAAKEGHDHIFQLLLTTGANLGTRDNWEYTALDDAVENGHTAVVKLILSQTKQSGQSGVDWKGQLKAPYSLESKNNPLNPHEL